MTQSSIFPSWMRPRHCIAAALLALIAGVAYSLTGSPFEGADGNLLVDTGTDWESLIGEPLFLVGFDLPSGQQDDSLGGKEDDEEPDLTFGSIPGNKSDLIRFYVFHEVLGPEEDERDYLYLGWVRSNTLGTANMDFEFNRSKTVTGNGVTLVRTPGDLLINFGFAGGGNKVELSLSRWTDTGPCEASPSPPCWGELMPLTGVAEGEVNRVPVFDPIVGQTLPELTFGEAAIDLTGAGVFDRATCTTFGQAFVKSRSSDSFTSSLKDFIQPVDVSVSNCSILTVGKDAVPDDGQDFAFMTPGGLSPASFQLDDDGNENNDLPSRLTSEGPLEGPYSVAEEAVEGWDLTDITCTGNAAPVLDAQGLLTGEVTMDLAKGEPIDCTFTNTRRGSILVDEFTIPGGEPQPFQFHLGGGPEAVAQDFSLADASPNHDSGTLRPGTYAVTQTDPGIEWDLTSATCSDGSAPGQVVLDPGETVICTFINTKRGRILVDNEVLPAGDPQEFPFTLTGGPSALNASFVLADLDPPYDSGYILPGGMYAASQTVPQGYFPTGAFCDDGSPVSDIQVDPGETVLCTFRSVKGGRIRIDKVTDPAGDPALFEFTLTGGPTTQAFSLTDAEAPYDTGALQPGSTYQARESSSPDWDLTGLGCTSRTGQSTFSITGANADPGFQPGDDRVAIVLGIADDVSCSFTNTKRGTLVVIKDAVPDDSQAFAFAVSGPGTSQGFVLSDPASKNRTFTRLTPGSYTVTETDPGPAWDLADLECRESDGGKVGAADTSAGTVNLYLAPGETVTCVFTNVKRGMVVVEKFVVNEPVPGVAYNPRAVPFDFDASWGESFTLTHGQTHDSPLLPGGSSESVREQKPSGWETTSTCVYPDGTTTTGGTTIGVTVPVGETVYCTFVNEVQIHPGSSGFWRNWDNHYTETQMRQIINEALAGSPCYASLFGEPVADALDVIESIYAAGGDSTDQRVLMELTTLMFNLAVSKSDDPDIRALQRNHDICRDCILDVSGIPGGQELIEEWNSSITFEQLIVDDLISVAEAVCSGDITMGEWSFDPMTEVEKVTLKAMLEGTNQGRTLTPDLSTYPDRPGCLRLPAMPDATELMFYSSTVGLREEGAPFGQLIGHLPPGLSLDQNTLEISGIPEPVGLVPVTTSFKLAVWILSEGKFEIRSFSITVNPWPRIITTSCPEAVMQVPYSEALLSLGGTYPMSWSILSGEPPDGLALDPLTGTITGIPAALKPPKSTLYSFEVALTDANGAQDTSWLEIMVLPSGDLTCDPPPAAPTEAPVLDLVEWDGETLLFWTAVPGGAEYDVVLGDLGILAGTEGDFTSATLQCLAPALSSTFTSYSGVPGPGEGFWFLVRPLNCGGTGTFDSLESTQSGSRDAEIEASGGSCSF